MICRLRIFEIDLTLSMQTRNLINAVFRVGAESALPSVYNDFIYLLALSRTARNIPHSQALVGLCCLYREDFLNLRYQTVHRIF